MSPEKSWSVRPIVDMRFWRLRQASSCWPRESPAMPMVTLVGPAWGVVVKV